MMKKILTGVIVIILLAITTVVPCINANTLQIENLAQQQSEKNTTNSTISHCSGSIYGTTYVYKGWCAYPLPFTLVKARGTGVFRRSRSDFNAEYKLCGLPLNHTYTVTARFLGYSNIYGPQNVTLTADHPYVEVHFRFKFQDPEQTPNKKKRVLDSQK